MQDLTVIGIENGALLVASESGERYRVAIDEVLQSRLRQSTTQADSGVKVSPREIQAQIRAGMSAEDVARATGASLEFVERFEGPVVAERLHIVSSALRVPVKVASSIDPLSDDQSSTFGDVVEERLEGLGATDLRWASWKEETGWVVKLTFTASEIDHDARWQFDPKRHALTPLNSGAVTLSQHGEIVEGLIPRLRAVDADGRRNDPGAPGGSSIARAESAGLALDELDDAFPLDTSDEAEPAASSSDPTAPPVLVEPTPFSRSPFARTAEESSPAAAAAAVTRQAPGPAAQNETADLLEALRRRRGEREAAPFTLDGDDDFDALASTGHPSTRDSGTVASGSRGDTRPVAHLTRGSSGATGATPVPTGSPEGSQGTAGPSGVTTLDGLEETTPQQRQTGPQPRSKRRAAMPSWDEIVFGARTDDDLG
ncbi:septation protein SepH [Subtercola sp. YIM 133946]|uniref:septation protein SepH n=1 Tax=Subtercola sp. YIM 133946 TaxID=3118909 RepID=UPI002F924940